MATVIVMPRLSPTMEEGVLAKWTKKEGDKIAPGDIIAEVETDKANMDFPLEDEGVLLKLLVKAGDTVKLGAPVAIIGEAGEDISEALAEAEGSGGAAPAPAEKEPAKAKAAPAAQKAAPAAPKAAPAAKKAAPAAPKAAQVAPKAAPAKKAAPAEEAEEPAEETEEPAEQATAPAEQDSAPAEQDSAPAEGEEAPAEGEEAPAEGEEASAEGQEAPAEGEEAPAEGEEAQAEGGEAPAEGEEAPAEGAGAPAGRILASPLARRLADEAGVDIRKIAGSGPGGRIVKRDIEQAAAAAKSAPKAAAAAPKAAAPKAAEAPKAAAAAPAAKAAAPAKAPLADKDELVPMAMIRRTAAKRLVEAKQTVPHFYLTAEAGVDALWRFREELNATATAAGGDKVSVNDLVLKALARALKVVPTANMSVAPDGQNAIKHNRVDISVAVALGEGEGLITPVVRGADSKSVGALSREVRELAARGREKRLRPEEYTGGTFSLTNLGMYGIREFFAIVNPPESGILAVGKVEKRAVVHESPAKDDEIRIERRMTLTLSCDHRIIDGALGARLFAEIVRGLENPLLLVL